MKNSIKRQFLVLLMVILSLSGVYGTKEKVDSSFVSPDLSVGFSIGKTLPIDDNNEAFTRVKGILDITVFHSASKSNHIQPRFAGRNIQHDTSVPAVFVLLLFVLFVLIYEQTNNHGQVISIISYIHNQDGCKPLN